MKTYTEAQRKMMAALGVTEAECEPKQAPAPAGSADVQELREKVAALEAELEAAKILLGVD